RDSDANDDGETPEVLRDEVALEYRGALERARWRAHRARVACSPAAHGPMRRRPRDRRRLSFDARSSGAVRGFSRTALAWSGAVSFRHLEAPAYRSGYRPRVTLDASTQSTIVLALAAVVLLLLVWVALLQRSEARLRSRLRRVLTGGETTSLDQILDQQVQRLDGLSGRLDALNKLHHELEAITQRAIQKVGVVRYNPFSDAGGD